MITKTVLTTSPQHQACFVAGTLVHTKDGLKPIQDIKVGDMVSSRDENNPDGEMVYKKVLNTFKSAEKQKIVYIPYMTERGNGYLFCTENHPFWIDDYTQLEHDEDLRVTSIHREPMGWTLAKDINLQLLRSFDKNTFIHVMRDIYAIQSLRCDSKDAYYAGLYGYDGIDEFVDFSQDKPMMIVPEQGSKFAEYYPLSGTLLKSEETIVYDDEHPDASKIFKGSDCYREDYEDYVYNIEVEGYHTYFVGDIGIWVHNCDPRTINTILKPVTKPCARRPSGLFETC